MNKSEILDTVKHLLSAKVQRLQMLIADTRASNNDTKSSMGDKYETGREMLQQEIGKLQLQLGEILKQENILKSITAAPCDSVQRGALVKTDRGAIYIAVPLGHVTINGEKITVISSDSPLAVVLRGRKAGETVPFGNYANNILEVC